jgi:hypothetical protein
MNAASHFVLLPTYNTGPRLLAVVAEVVTHWPHVLVVVDGSTDGSEQPVVTFAKSQPGLTVLQLPINQGKGAAVLAGARAALARGFTHALVMDADGQHPADSIGEFMADSLAHPTALVLGRPIFPANIPAERLHGRKLSVGLVRVELLGPGIADPLFGFRVYPLAPLLALLGQRRGGRRYDFDTEAAVRLGWAGVPLRNLAAPVRYFSRAEGGVSHFHYLRDNLTLVWLHTRLIVELLCWRWPALLRRRRAGRSALVVLAALLLVCPGVGAAEPEERTMPNHPVTADSPDWSDLVAAFACQSDTTADFTELRQFPFTRKPVELQGEVRVSLSRGLSLHYLLPEERTVILDATGMLIRTPSGETIPPVDPRASAANEALRHVLRFELAALEPDFALDGQRDGDRWTLTLVPRTDALRRTLAQITVTGEGATIRRIELRRSARQVIEIRISAPRPAAGFTSGELKTYFR